MASRTASRFSSSTYTVAHFALGTRPECATSPLGPEFLASVLVSGLGKSPPDDIRSMFCGAVSSASGAQSIFIGVVAPAVVG